MTERDDPRIPRRPEPDLELLRVAGPRSAVPRETELRVREAVLAHWRENVDSRRRHRLSRLAVSLAAAATIVLLILLPRWRSAAPAVVGAVEVVAGEARIGTAAGDTAAVAGMQLPEGAVVNTGADGRLALRFGDTSIRIDTSSRVALASAVRLTLDNGAVYIDAGASAEGRSLTVATPLADVHEIGTQFEVRLLDGCLRVRVREGSAVVQRGTPLYTLAAGEEVSLARDGALRVGRVASTDPGWDWVVGVAPPFRLEGGSAASFLRWSTRETGMVLRWASPQLAAAAESMVLHGDATGFPPDQAPAAVLPTCGLTFRVDDGTLLVSRGDR